MISGKRRRKSRRRKRRSPGSSRGEKSKLEEEKREMMQVGESEGGCTSEAPFHPSAAQLNRGETRKLQWGVDEANFRTLQESSLKSKQYDTLSFAFFQMMIRLYSETTDTCSLF